MMAAIRGTNEDQPNLAAASRRRRLAALLGPLAIAVAVAGCSSGGGSAGTTSSSTSPTSTSTTSSTTTSTTSTSTSVPVSSAAMAAARAALLTIDDVPSNYTATPQSKAGGPTHAQSVQIARCLGVPPSDIEYNPPEADAPEFDGPNGLPSIDDSIAVFPDVAVARGQFLIFESFHTPNCLAQAFSSYEAQLRKSLPAGSTIGSVAASRVSFPSLGDASADILLGFPIEVPQASGMATVVVDIDLVVVLKGRYGVTLTVGTSTSPLATGVLYRYARLNVSRLP